MFAMLCSLSLPLLYRCVYFYKKKNNNTNKKEGDASHNNITVVEFWLVTYFFSSLSAGQVLSVLT